MMEQRFLSVILWGAASDAKIAVALTNLLGRREGPRPVGWECRTLG